MFAEAKILLIYWTAHAAKNNSLERNKQTSKEWPFYFRIDNYRHSIKLMDCNKSKLVEQYFCPNSEDFKRDVRFTIIERIEKRLIGQYNSDNRCTNG